MIWIKSTTIPTLPFLFQDDALSLVSAHTLVRHFPHISPSADPINQSNKEASKGKESSLNFNEHDD
jgi:hypothetical protein